MRRVLPVNDLGFHLLTMPAEPELLYDRRMAADKVDPKSHQGCHFRRKAGKIRSALGVNHRASLGCTPTLEIQFCAGLMNGRNSLPLSRRSRLPTRLPLSARPHFTQIVKNHGPIPF